jgi:hypothetical protein
MQDRRRPTRQQFVNQIDLGLRKETPGVGHVPATAAAKEALPLEGATPVEPATIKSPWAAVDERTDAHPYSPARDLQESLSDHFAGRERRWSKRATLLFTLAFCGGFWGAVAIAASVVLR